MPPDGAPKGNKTLLEEFKKLAKTEFSHELSDDEYWDERNLLIGKGELVKAKGKGGSVRLIEIRKEKSPLHQKKNKEQDLYKPFIDYVKKLWVKDNGVKDYIVQNTANQGKQYPGFLRRISLNES